MQPKATTPLHTPRMKRLSPGRWLVESKTTPGIGHQCTVDACGCKAGSFGQLCWHRKLVRQAEAWYAAGGASAPVPPVPAPVPATPAVAGDWHTSAETGMRAFHVSAAYRGLAECFGE